MSPRPNWRCWREEYLGATPGMYFARCSNVMGVAALAGVPRSPSKVSPNQGHNPTEAIE